MKFRGAITWGGLMIAGTMTGGNVTQLKVSHRLTGP